MILKKTESLDIAKSQFDFSNENTQELDYSKWIEYIESQPEYYFWKEDTIEGKEVLSNVDKIPESFRERVLKAYNKRTACAEFDYKKGFYNVLVTFRSEHNRIGINFEKIPTKSDLMRFLKMANHLNALLLNNGSEVIDENVIEELK